MIEIARKTIDKLIINSFNLLMIYNIIIYNINRITEEYNKTSQ